MNERMLRNLMTSWRMKADEIAKVDPRDPEVHRFRECAKELELVLDNTGWARLTFGRE